MAYSADGLKQAASFLRFKAFLSIFGYGFLGLLAWNGFVYLDTALHPLQHVLATAGTAKIDDSAQQFVCFVCGCIVGMMFSISSFTEALRFEWMAEVEGHLKKVSEFKSVPFPITVRDDAIDGVHSPTR